MRRLIVSPVSFDRSHDIIFSEEDLWGIQTPHNDAIVVSMTKANCDVKWCFVDNENSTDVLFYDIFFGMRLSTNQLKLVNMPLIGFTDDSIKIEGEIELFVIVGQ